MSEDVYRAARLDRDLEEFAKGFFKPKMVTPPGAKHAKPRPKTSAKEDVAMSQGYRGARFERARPPGTTGNLNPYKANSKQGQAYSRGRSEYSRDTAGGYWLSQPGKHVDHARRMPDAPPGRRTFL